MRRVIALAAATAFAATAASAETWTKFVDGPNGTQWSYDADYTYKDKASGRLVVMQAVSKPEAKLGPSGPGKPDGVGYVYAIDCGKKNLITVAAYKPSTSLKKRPAPRTRPCSPPSARTRTTCRCNRRVRGPADPVQSLTGTAGRRFLSQGPWDGG